MNTTGLLNRDEYCLDLLDVRFPSIMWGKALLDTALSSYISLFFFNAAKARVVHAVEDFRSRRIAQGSIKSAVAVACVAVGYWFGAFAVEYSNTAIFCPRSIRQL